MAARPMQHRFNALICALVLAHAIYWFFSDSFETATTLRTSLRAAQAVLGLFGMVWFWRRSQQSSA
jgi:high-affinity Fe2+/Pb2+ permease